MPSDNAVVPPMVSVFSSTTTFSPARAADSAAMKPAAPEPTTSRS